MRHALVVGGTGMLRGVCLGLAADGWAVSVVARRHAGLSRLAAEGAGLPGRINPVPGDYTDWPALAAGIRAACVALGRIELVVAWIHSTAPGGPRLLAELVADEGRPCRFFHVVGCEWADPAGRAGEPAAGVAGVSYRPVVLGFVVEEGGSRWLTDGEIAAGVLAAVRQDRHEYVVGVVRPWERRPAW